MNQIKESLYNHFLPVSSDKVVGYNFLYRTMLLLDVEEFKEVEAIRQQLRLHWQPALEADLCKALIKHRFLISSSFDELEYFKFGYFKSLYNSSVLVTMVLPTLNCNFDCPYCFEYKKNISMSDETVAAYLRWVAAKLHDKKHFHITWFGGEPLLALKQMRHITHEAMELCKAANCGYSASLTTNGYFLTEKVIPQLDEMKIANVHVTLDGPPEVHNLYRKTKDGRGTFSRIIDNISTWCRLSKSHLPLTIRINVTDENIGVVPNMFHYFDEESKKRTRVYFRYVWSNEASEHKVFSTRANRDDSFEGLANLYEAATKAGLNVENTIDEINFNYCEVDLANHFAIDPLGYIYLCGHTFQPDEAIGHINHDFSDEQLSNYCKWINVNPFDDEECRHCRLLPVCKGGCRKGRFNGQRPCIEERNAVDLYVGNLYQKWIQSNRCVNVDN
jgi:uncharacterized protein